MGHDALWPIPARSRLEPLPHPPIHLRLPQTLTLHPAAAFMQTVSLGGGSARDAYHNVGVMLNSFTVDLGAAARSTRVEVTPLNPMPYALNPCV